MVLHKTEVRAERAFLLGVLTRKQTRWEVEDNLSELAALSYTAGAIVIDSIIQEREHYDAAFLIGKGKANEIAGRIEEEDISLIIFDDELTPAQIKNLGQLFKIKIIDRPALILEIFALRALTKEARTQVELAQLNYLLPRLTGQWTHLSRQVGGIGTKGPGETQLETDRRLIRKRITNLNLELKKIEQQRKIQQKQQEKFIRVALVGYTNAGKSTIMNALTDAHTIVEDKLFATLDTTTRKLYLDKSFSVLLSDTVGFIRKLPPHLIASFKATLLQTIKADIILHVIDISNPVFDVHIKIVNNILQELDAHQIPMILLFNKVDKIHSEGLLKQTRAKYPNAVFISARKKIRLEKIYENIFALIKNQYIIKEIDLNYSNATVMKKIEEIAYIMDRIYNEQKITLKLLVSKENEHRLTRFMHQNQNNESYF
jgi:GTP-binding protein HflX